VSSQGELINQIDNSVSMAKDYVEDGNKQASSLACCRFSSVF